MTRNAIKYYVQLWVMLALIGGAAFSILPMLSILVALAAGISATEAIESIRSEGGAAYIWLALFMATWGVWADRRGNLRRGITADFLGGLSWRERADFWKKQNALGDKGTTSN